MSQFRNEWPLRGGGEERAWQELKAVLAARIKESLGGKISAKSVDAILEEELNRDRRV